MTIGNRPGPERSGGRGPSEMRPVSFTLGEDGSYNPRLHNLRRLGVVCTYGGARWLSAPIIRGGCACAQGRMH